MFRFNNCQIILSLPDGLSDKQVHGGAVVEATFLTVDMASKQILWQVGRFLCWVCVPMIFIIGDTHWQVCSIQLYHCYVKWVVSCTVHVCL